MKFKEYTDSIPNSKPVTFIGNLDDKEEYRQLLDEYSDVLYYDSNATTVTGLPLDGHIATYLHPDAMYGMPKYPKYLEYSEKLTALIRAEFIQKGLLKE